MTLAETQDAALAALAGLFTPENSSIEQVYTEDPGQLYTLPCLLIYDEGMLVTRFQAWREIAWDLRLQVFVPSFERRNAQQQARAIRTRVLDLLDDHITLDGKVSRTEWRDALRVAQLEYEETESGNQYFGLDGVYRLYIKDNRGFAA